ncbi:MAG: hypothetical protein ABI623_00885 [bacterium]
MRGMLAGMAATVIMDIVSLMRPVYGLLSFSYGEAFGEFFGVSVYAGWILHYVMSMFFAVLYVSFLRRWFRSLPASKACCLDFSYGFSLRF